MPKKPSTLPYLAAGLLAAAPASAQDAPAPAAEAPAAEAPKVEMTMEERKQSIVVLTGHIADREERIVELRDDIIRLDGRVEKRITKIVDKLKSMDDSTESGVRVAQTKSEAIQGLRKTIDYYVRKRDDLREALRTGASAIPDDQLQETKQVFDERIEKRVAQIVELAQSFTAHEELEKYDKSTQSAWGWSWTNYSISDDWRQNRSATRRSASQSKEVAEALEASIARLDVRRRDIVEKLRVGKLTDGQREILEADRDELETQISIRRNQIEEVFQVRGGGTRVSRNEAHRVQQALRDDARDLRDDFFDIFEIYAELQNERVQVARLKENLQARKDWMAEHGDGKDNG